MTTAPAKCSVPWKAANKLSIAAVPSADLVAAPWPSPQLALRWSKLPKMSGVSNNADGNHFHMSVCGKRCATDGAESLRLPSSFVSGMASFPVIGLDHEFSGSLRFSVVDTDQLRPRSRPFLSRAKAVNGPGTSCQGRFPRVEAFGLSLAWVKSGVNAPFVPAFLRLGTKAAMVASL
jgi:hypothetical protein